jgi:hypothetical protein
MRNPLTQTGDELTPGRPGSQELTSRYHGSTNRITDDLIWMRNDREVTQFLLGRFPLLLDAPKIISRHCQLRSCRQLRQAGLWFHVIQAYFRAGLTAERVAQAYNAQRGVVTSAMAEISNEGDVGHIDAEFDVIFHMPRGVKRTTPAMIRRVAQMIREAAAGKRLDGKPRSFGRPGRKPRASTI